MIYVLQSVRLDLISEDEATGGMNAEKVFWLLLIKGTMGWPLWVSSSFAAATMLIAFHLLKQAVPPALAIALLPTILPATYPWQVFWDSSAFIALSRMSLPLNARVPAAGVPTPE